MKSKRRKNRPIKVEVGNATASAAQVTWKSNALRHSFASYRLADVQSAAQVSLEMGNSPQMVFKHYREIVKPSAAKEWFSLFPKSESNIIQIQTAAL